MNNKKILVIEDNPANLKLVNDLLTVEGYDVLKATDGISGLEMMKEYAEEISLVLLDLKLPDINGLEVLKKAKTNTKTEKIPIIVVSAHAMEADIINSKATGCIDHITKPLNIMEFLSKVKSAV